MTSNISDPRQLALLEGVLPHVAFDGWSEVAFNAGCEDAGIDLAEAKAMCPRGASDLAVLYHQEGDRAMIVALATADLSEMRFRDKVAHAVRLRLAAVDDKEVVRRGTTLFALPHMAPEGSKLIWGTADAIWTALGDTSEDVNWYTKRTTLSAVYGSVVLFWLGDESDGGAATDEFIDRRIENVMQFEKLKAAVNKNPLLKPLTGPLGRLMAHVRAPKVVAARDDLPGQWNDDRPGQWNDPT